MRILYKITNLINGKCYIGQTKHFERRMYEHRKPPCKERPSLIRTAILKHGKENFSFEKLAILEDREIDRAEQKAIEIYKSVSPYGYNIEIGGFGQGCKKISESTKQKLREINFGVRGKHHANLGKPNSPEQKLKISLTARRKKDPTLTMEKLIEILNTPKVKKIPKSQKGRVFSEETKKKMSESAKRKIITPEHRAKMNNGIKTTYKLKREQKEKKNV